jgi:antitoxin component YwqK of YwqJK toxin-antitoxin module
VSGEVFEEHGYCHGLLHGLEQGYRRNGILWIDEVYKDGRLHGVSTSYHDKGNTEIKAQ